MSITSTTSGIGYMDLVERFPLRPLRTASQHKTALRIIDELMTLPENQLTAGQTDYLAAIGRFVTDYENEHFVSKLADTKPIDVVLHLMDSRGMTPADLGDVIGSRSAATMILHGDRDLSKAQIRLIAEHFHVTPALFI